MTAFIHGFGTGAGLIIAIGAQNAFVLARGVKRQHHLLVAFVCIICDIAFIAAGTALSGLAVSSNPAAARATTTAGAAYLIFFGAASLRSAFRGGDLEATDREGAGIRATVLQTLAVTLLNPHFYLDTFVLLGSLSAGFPGNGRWIFAFGAMSASVVWFLSLAQGSRLLAPIFRREHAWQVFDILIAVIMWSIAASLLLHSWR